MSLNAYEIRLELLRMAQTLVIEGWYKRCDAIKSTWDTKYNSPATIAARMEEKIPVGELNFPSIPSSKDILKKANELYSFIEDDNRPKERGVCNGTGPGRAAGGRGEGRNKGNGAGRKQFR